jgi:hypothetical protein
MRYAFDSSNLQKQFPGVRIIYYDPELWARERAAYQLRRQMSSGSGNAGMNP